MVEIVTEDATFKGHDGHEMELYVARPDSGKHPAIIVIHEVFGLNENIRDITRRFAREGYTVFAPNLYSRKKDVLNEKNLEEGMKAFLSLSPERRGDKEAIAEATSSLSENSRKAVEIVFSGRGLLEDEMTRDLLALYAHANSSEHVLRDSIGATGFCLGGGMAFEFACASPLKSVFVFYGRNPSLIDKISGMTASYFAVYAGEDPGIDAGLPDLAAAMFRLKKNFGMKMYAGVLHGFFNDTRQSFNKEAAEDAWKLALHHFGSTLGR